MSDDRYNLRWKGKILGPFSRRQIERKIRDHDLGMLHEIDVNGHWITLREFLAPEKDSDLKTSVNDLTEDAASNEEGTGRSLPPPRWLTSGYITIFLLIMLGMLGWTHTWIAPWGWAPLIGLGLGLIGGLFGLLTLFQGEKNHGLLIIALSIVLAFANMMLA